VAPGAFAATQKSKVRTPNLDEALDDQDAFIRFVRNSTASKSTPEYRELYQFLLQCFLEADTNFDGRVGADRFDYMVERAACLPRKFGYAPTEDEIYPTPQHRVQARAALFRTIDTDGSGEIAFDEWLEWAFTHIRGKASTLNPNQVSWNQDAQSFTRWIVAACRSTSSKEYKELYHFLQECFTSADQDLDGRVNRSEFDQLIEMSADAPRRFGFAPSEQQTYRTPQEKNAARNRMWAEMDNDGNMNISFDEWMAWSFRHICGKARQLDPTLSGAPPLAGAAPALAPAPCPFGFGRAVPALAPAPATVGGQYQVVYGHPVAMPTVARSF